mgnify:FL=1
MNLDALREFSHATSLQLSHLNYSGFGTANSCIIITVELSFNDEGFKISDICFRYREEYKMELFSQLGERESKDQ